MNLNYFNDPWLDLPSSRWLPSCLALCLLVFSLPVLPWKPMALLYGVAYSHLIARTTALRDKRARPTPLRRLALIISV